MEESAQNNKQLDTAWQNGKKSTAATRQLIKRWNKELDNYPVSQSKPKRIASE
jgi:hypothetical protein